MSCPSFLLSLLGACLLLGISPAQAAPTPTPSAAPFLPAPDIISTPLPWIDGESLTYVASWNHLEAAEGTFTAHDKSDHWEFDLALASGGAVNTIYPFTGQFWSLLNKSPWRSTEYGEYRFEPFRTIRERTQINYVTSQGTREIWSEGKTHVFPIGKLAIDDVGSMLYHLRAWSWNPGDKRTLYVYESDSQKQGEVECQGRETRAWGIWPSQPLVRIMAIPTVGTHRRGHLLCWMTDDARHLPLHAELEFRYGTFVLDLTKADKTLPIGH